MMKMLRKFTNWLRKKFPDPVRSCNLFNDEGCAHVDGLLCDFPNCSMEKEYSQPKIIVSSHFDFDEYCSAHNINDKNVEKMDDTAFISIIGTPEVLEYYLQESGTKHWFKKKHPNVLNLKFDDVSQDREITYTNGENRGITIHAYAMTDKQAKECVDFIEKNLGKTFRIHCRAGISRSFAVGAYISQMYDLYSHIDMTNGTPNMAVLGALKREFYRRNKMFV